MTLIHATCVAIDGVGVLIRGPSGSGKSDLALRLIDRGATLVSDDYCDVYPEDSCLMATAPAAIAGKLEVRGYGIVPLPCVDGVAIKLIADLRPKEDIERMPDSETCTIDGIAVRRMVLDAETHSAPAKIRLALNHPAEDETGKGVSP